MTLITPRRSALACLCVQPARDQDLWGPTAFPLQVRDDVETGHTRHVLGDNHGCRRPVQTTNEKVGSRVVGLHIESEGSSNTVSKVTTPRHH
jgi:hypothetical protein